MPPDIRFWRNLTLIGLAHVALIAGLVHWSRTASKPSEQNVFWISGGGDGAATEPQATKLSMPLPERTPRLFSKSEENEERPVLTSVDSEIQMPASTPKPTPRSISKPAPTATQRRSVPPTPAPKPKPTPTAKPIKKKLVLAKASPKPSLKPEPKENDEDEDKPGAVEKKPTQEKAEQPHPAPTEKPVTKAAQGAGGKGSSPGVGGRIGGPGGESQFGWYGSMLHDRLYSEWAQPTAVASAGEKFSVMVKLRIQRDGRITNFEIVKSSGNSTVDESVQVVANRVTQVDPLPAGLGGGDHYDVKINFELSSE